jgi:hypothetical protein
MMQGQSKPVVPTQGDIEAWRMEAQTRINFGGVRLGEFNWPQAVLSLIAEVEKSNGQ